LIQDTGEDIVGTIGGNDAVGKGNVLVGSTGDSVGVSVQLLASAADATLTELGTVGEVAISNNSLVFQVGANKGQTVSIGVNSVASKGLGIGVEDNSFTNLSEINVQSAQGAQDALGVLDASIDEISNLRGTLGAFQANTLESTANNMRTTLENTVNAESVIRDTDFAEEISNFTNSQVLVQAGTSVLSSANQSSQLILSLLG
jgi:flagellin